MCLKNQPLSFFFFLYHMRTQHQCKNYKPHKENREIKNKTRVIDCNIPREKPLSHLFWVINQGETKLCSQCQRTELWSPKWAQHYFKLCIPSKTFHTQKENVTPIMGSPNTVCIDASQTNKKALLGSILIWREEGRNAARWELKLRALTQYQAQTGCRLSRGCGNTWIGLSGGESGG